MLVFKLFPSACIHLNSEEDEDEAAEMERLLQRVKQRRQHLTKTAAQAEAVNLRDLQQAKVLTTVSVYCLLLFFFLSPFTVSFYCLLLLSPFTVCFFCPLLLCLSIYLSLFFLLFFLLSPFAVSFICLLLLSPLILFSVSFCCLLLLSPLIALSVSFFCLL